VGPAAIATFAVIVNPALLTVWSLVTCRKRLLP